MVDTETKRQRQKMKVSANQADAFVSAVPGTIFAILIYGPDLGLIRERAVTALTSVAGAPSDPFNVVEFTQTALRDDPSRITDEASTISITGSRRVIRIREATDTITDAVSHAISVKGDALIIVEGGELSPRSKLRALFEKSDHAAAIPCYLDDGKGLTALVRETLLEENLSASPDVILWIASNLGVDRMVSRMELEKLKLYMAGNKTVTLEDAQSIIGDAAALTIDDVIYAAAGGDLPGLAISLSRAHLEDVSSISILRSTNRHFTRLEQACAYVTKGLSTDQAIKKLRPPIFFRREEAFRHQVKKWRPELLIRARDSLIHAEIECKKNNAPASDICDRVLMRLAVMAGATIVR